MRKNIFFKLLFLFAGILLVQQKGFAQFEEGKEEIIFGLPALNGLGIVATANNTTTYTGVSEDSNKITNIITFKINESWPVYPLSNFTATVYFTVDRWDSLSGSPVQTSKTLTINYDSSTGAKFNVRSYLILPRSEKVQITVDSIHISGYSGWNPLKVLQLENEMKILRYFTLSNDPAYLTPSFNSPGDSTDALHVSWTWNAQTNNNMTQLEWAWVEDEMAPFYPSTDSLFGINSTRVDVDFSQNNYKIPMLYDGEGKLYYRIRAAQRKNDGSMITGPWSDAEVDSSFNGHEPNLNWQSSTSFAENGKLKTVIQYFDGSLRNRQTVTKDNTTGNTIVAETIYDLQGRANIQILPTPIFDNKIKYFEDFNRFKGQVLDGNGVIENPAKYFDLTPTAVLCNRSIALDSTHGNGKYYSNHIRQHLVT